MKTTLEPNPTESGYIAKEGRMHLMQINPVTGDKDFLGEALIDLSEYASCGSRSLFSADLKQSPFQDARIEFYIMATPLSIIDGRERSSTETGIELKSSMKISKSQSTT